MERSTTHKKLGLHQMVVVGMLSGISIFMGLTGIGFIPLPFMKATIMHIPTIIGAIIEGPLVGGLVGGVFGLFSIYQAFTAPLPTSFIFYNPIIAIVPRVLIAIVAYYVYKFLKSKIKKESLAIGIASVLATLTNTAGVLGLTYVFYLDKYAHVLGLAPSAAGAAIATVGVTNGIPEAILSAIITIPVITALKKIKK